MKFKFGNSTTDAKRYSTFQKKLAITKEADLNSPSDFLPPNQEIPLLSVHFTQLSKGNKVEIEASAGWTAGFPCEPATIKLTIRRNPDILVAETEDSTQDLQMQKTTALTGSETLSDNAELAIYTLYASTEQAQRIRMSGSFRLRAVVRLNI
ncbi:MULTISPECIES: hypothetical protein [Fictibacillus]|uniref:Uncharacterized protein n=1 Tax=Fictibacillus enclensis TaxID=1017270 RepID=A0A0V8JBK9_9BACL|nr:MULTISPECIES: hypothetical protein [Fictibacillus]KSU84252.1 hypothetical protein AS030_01430 [Fictibacillus enclensis]RXZ00132.1 hypothetical protein DMO16_10805 [Fictibacillus sp. S7]SCB75843.1 hypothetical protein GA0061096_0300 [Fictibacillus enclensis]